MPSGIRNIHEFIFSLRIVLFLAVLPFLLHWVNMNRLVRILTPKKPSGFSRHIDRERAIYMVNRILRIFQERGYRYTCLKRSLLLYHFMRVIGIPLVINFGIRWEDGALTGHSWLTEGGLPFSEPEGKMEKYTKMFSLPDDSVEKREMNIRNIKLD